MMRWRTTRGVGALVLIGALLSPSMASVAAAGQAGTRRERVSVGAFVTLFAGVKRWGAVSLRVSVPAGDKAGLDFDIGRVISPKVDDGELPYGWTGGAQLRWLPKGRSATGWSGFILIGPRFMQMRHLKDPTSGYLWKAVNLGFGVDRVLANGARAGFEVGSAMSEGPMPFLNVFGVWGPRAPK